MSQTKDQERGITTKESVDSYSSASWVSRMVFVDLFSLIIGLTGASFILIGAANSYSITQSYDKSSKQFLVFINQLTTHLLQMGLGSAGVLVGWQAPKAIKKMHSTPLPGRNRVKSLPQEVLTMSDKDLIKKARAEFQQRYAELREEKHIAFNFSELPEIDDPFLTAVKEKRSIAFIIPPEKHNYKEYASDSLTRFMKDLNKERDEPFKEPKYEFYEENESNRSHWCNEVSKPCWSGDINSKEEVVVIVSPPLCRFP